MPIRKKVALAGAVALVGATLGLSGLVSADPFPPNWGAANEAGGPVHFAPVAWPNEPALAKDCGTTCGEWKPYSRFQDDINDPRVQDPSNGGTSPQNYVNVSSSCIDKSFPSIYYHLRQGAAADGSQDVIMFRWRVEQIANNYATGPSAGNYGATDPWSSALWTVLFDVDGDGYRDIAAHLNGSSGTPGAPIDMIAGIWGNIPTQSIDYTSDPNIKLIAHNPTAFTSGGKLLNFHNSLSPDINWPNGSTETVWDYGTTRSTLVYTNACNEYFVDYQIPVRMLDASSTGPNGALNGPKITRSTPISMLFCTANSLNNPFQKDCSLNRSFIGDATKPGPFGDYVSFDQDKPYSQPIIRDVTAVAPNAGTCSSGYTLNATVQDTLAVNDSGAVIRSVKGVSFWYYHDANGDGISNDGNNWTFAANATPVPNTLNKWTATWDSTTLAKGRYLVGVQAVDDRTLHDDGVADAPVDNRTFSYVTSNAMGEVYIGGAWQIAQGDFPGHSPAMTPIAGENWYGNPAITGIQVATAGVDLAINSCGVAPTLQKAADKAEVGPGETLSYTLTLSNPANASPLTVSSVTDTLPAGFSYVGASTTGSLTSTNPVVIGQTLSWNFAPVTIPPGTSATLSFQATASATAGSYNNVARAGTSFGDIESEPVPVTVGSARLSLSKTPTSGYSTAPGGTVSYTLNYANPTGVTITNAVLSDPLPANTTLASCSNSCANNAGTLSWNLGTLPGGASGSVTVTLNVSAGYATTSLTNSATLTGKDPANTDVSATAASTVYVNVPIGAIAAFTLDKAANAVSIAPGATVTYTLSYNNYGGAAASNVVITDTLPAGLTYNAASCAGSGMTSCSHAAGVVTWNFASIAAGTSGTVSFTATAATPFTAANPAINNASLSWAAGGPVTAQHQLGITGTSCTTNYFSDTLGDVGSAGSKYVTTTSTPVGAGTDIPAAAVTVALPQNTITEIARFYGPVSSYINFSSGSSTVAGQVNYVKTGNGNLTLLVSTYDYDPATGAETLLGSATYPDNGSASPPVTLTAGTLTGALQKGHRLLWVIAAQNDTSNKTPGLQVKVNTSGSYAKVCSPAPANLTIDKTVSHPTVTEGVSTPITYTVRYTNTGATAATNVVIEDTLPAGVTFVSATLNGGNIVPTGSSPYSFAVGPVAAGGSGTLLIQASVDASASGVLTNSAAIHSDQTSPVSDNATTQVGSPGGGGGATSPNLSVMKSASKTQLGANDSVIYTLTVVNTGTGAANNVVVSDDYPEAGYFSFEGCTPSAGSCNGNGGMLTWNVGSLAAGASATLSYTMSTTASGLPSGVTVRNNTATAADDSYCVAPKPASCASPEVTVSISGNPVLTLDKTASPTASLKPGDVVTYTLQVGNSGSGQADGVVVRDAIPSGASYVSGSLLVGGASRSDAVDVDSAQFDAVNNQVVFSVGSLGSAATQTLSFQARVGLPPAGSSAISIANTASASASNAAGVQDSATVTGSATPSLTLTKSGPTQAPFPGARLSADVSAATEVAVNGSQLLSEGQTVSIGGTIRRIVGKTANSLVLDAAVTATANTPVLGAISYVLSYQNTGTGIAANAHLQDSLPGGSVFVSASHGGGESGGSVSWSLGNLAPGASGSVQLTVIPTAPGTLLNAAVLGCDGCVNATDSTSTEIGGLVVIKRTTTPLVAASTGTPLNSARYLITVSNSTGSAINGVAVKDLLPAGFTYKGGSTLVDAAPSGEPSLEGGDGGRPIWTIDVPANGSTTIRFDAEIATTVGAATYQNEVELTKGGVGITPFDALATPDEDVTVIGTDKGMIEGYVFRDNGSTTGSLDAGDSRFANIPVVLSRNGATCWPVDGSNAYSSDCRVTYTDGNGYFFLLAPIGNWTVAVIEASLPVSGLNLVVGTNATNVTVLPQQRVSDLNGFGTALPGVADMKVELTGFPASVAPGATVSGTMTCTNIGTVTATSASCSLSAPAGATVTCTPVPPTDVTAGGSISCSVSFTAPGSGSVAVNASTNAGNDSDSSNNTASTSVSVTPPPGSSTLSGHVYLDSNGNAGQDGGEPDYAGVEVVIVAGGSTLHVITDASGNYSVTLPAGAVSATVQVPTGFNVTTNGSGGTAAQSVTLAGSPLTATPVGLQPPAVCGTTARISGVVWQDGNRDGVMATPGEAPVSARRVPLTLIPQAGTVAPVQIRLTDANGAFDFSGVPPGNYLLQVQDANLDAAGLYPTHSSLYFTTLSACAPQVHHFGYASSLLPVLGDFVWLDVNGNGLQDEWFDANGDGKLTKNLPDAQGRIDYASWEWLDLNGDGSWSGPENEGELNKCGIGNAASANVHLSGPAAFSQQVIVGLQGYWRSRPGTGDGSYTATLQADDALRGAAAALSATGLCKPVASAAASAQTPRTAASVRAAAVSSCTVGLASAQANVVGASVHVGLDFPLTCSADAAVDLATLVGSAFIDSNANGLRDAGEPDLVGISVSVLTSQSSFIASITDALGGYSMQVPLGATTATIGTPAGYVLSTANNPQGFSAVAGTNTRPAVGFAPQGGATGGLSGHVFFDKNGNGQQDPGEADMPGAEVVVTLPSGLRLRVLTDSQGNYSLPLPLGSATVSVTDPNGLLLTTNNRIQSVTVSAGGTVLDPVGYQGGAVQPPIPVPLLPAAWLAALAGLVLLLGQAGAMARRRH